MAEELREGDWIRFKSSGFVNEGRVIEERPEGFRVEVPSGHTNIYVDLPKDSAVERIDPPAGD